MVGVGFKLASITVDADAWARFVAVSGGAGSSASAEVRRFVEHQTPLLAERARQLTVKDVAPATSRMDVARAVLAAAEKAPPPRRVSVPAPQPVSRPAATRDFGAVPPDDDWEPA